MSLNVPRRFQTRSIPSQNHFLAIMKSAAEKRQIANRRRVFIGCHRGAGMRSRWWPIRSRPCQGYGAGASSLVLLLFRLLAARPASCPLVNCGGSRGVVRLYS